MRFPWQAIIIGAGLIIVSPLKALSQPAQNFVKIDKPPEGTHILIIEPEVELTLLTATGTQEVKTEWSEAAAKDMVDAYGQYLNKHSLKTDRLDPNTLDSEDVQQVLKLNTAVTNAIGFNNFMHLPTKTSFDWTLGEAAALIGPSGEVAAKPRYALFTRIQGTYSSSGRAALAVGLALIGGGVPLGGQSVVASLVDLKTGQVVWFKIYFVPTGTDIRTPEGAKNAVDQMSKDLPL